MKAKRIKQVAVIKETTAELFESKLNAVLAQVPDPDIHFHEKDSLTAYVFYTVCKDQPETFLELLEMLASNRAGKSVHITCSECQHYEAPTDRRKVWGMCQRKNQPTTYRTPACEVFYLELREIADELLKEYEQIPFLIEGTAKK